MNIIIIIIIDLIMTIVLYMAYPFWKFSGKNTKYSEDTLIKTLLFNSLIVAIVMLILKITLFKKTSSNVFNFLPAFTYYWINKFIWKKKAYVDKNKSNKEKFRDRYKAFIITILILVVIAIIISSIFSYNDEKNKEKEKAKQLTDCIENAETSLSVRYNVFCTNGNYYEDECLSLDEKYHQKISKCLSQYGVE